MAGDRGEKTPRSFPWRQGCYYSPPSKHEFYPPPSPIGVILSSPGECFAHSGFSSQPRNTKLKKTWYFIIGSKQTCPTFAPEGNIIFIILTVNKTAPCSRGRHHYLHIPSLFTIQASCKIDNIIVCENAEIQETHEELSPIDRYYLIYLSIYIDSLLYICMCDICYILCYIYVIYILYCRYILNIKILLSL